MGSGEIRQVEKNYRFGSGWKKSALVQYNKKSRSKPWWSLLEFNAESGFSSDPKTSVAEPVD
jgi:hypothetical protein